MMTSSRGKKQQRTSHTKRAHLTFPVSRLHRYLKQRVFGRRAKKETAKSRPVTQVSKPAAVYLAAVLEYLVAELLEAAGNVTKEHKKKRISPRHIKFAIAYDEEIDKLLKDVTIAQGGVVPGIHSALLPKKKQKKGGQG